MCVGLLVLGAPGARAQDPVGAVVPVAASSSMAVSVPALEARPYAWRGHEAEVEEFLRTAVVERFTDIPVGVTKPRRGYFAPGGPVRSMAWKPLPEWLLNGKQESYRAEIAAYQLSRYLGLDVVPPVVERQEKGVRGAAVYWIDGVRPWNPAEPPKVTGPTWAMQLSRMMMFDQLVANTDRNQGNLLHDDAGHLYLIDHSRAFTTKRDLAGLKAPQQYDRALWERMTALTREDLTAALGQVLDASRIEAILVRRDQMARQIARRVADKGESVTFFPSIS
ncbi:hypothetical protein TBR22_A13250 [Luteitalea sp. TBR-22]|uniref:phosphatidylinositol 4-kinase n=1 Tax=Luteitalea sp. TBR-22 TaxID=2802971 RepID=UPI001AF87099|nr:phosphatidylinositol 4-kinase [Luteitalea sp. TBR-22]BCS32116.1 hypothetical protein TBR22_A13250 [Luteitalea sp. TBR-22]